MTRLTPFEQRLASGMSPLAAFLTDATCGEACWEAREDICRCSCGGRNHGCMRTADGTQPARTAKIDGMRYVLRATAPDRIDDNIARAEIYETARTLNGPTYRSWDTNVKHAPARIRNATKDQLARWPELASYREAIEAIKQTGRYCLNDIMNTSPILLWVRQDKC